MVITRGLERFDFEELPVEARFDMVENKHDSHLSEVLPEVTDAYDRLERLPKEQREHIERSLEKIETIFSEWECVLNREIKLVLVVLGLQDARNNRLVGGTLEHTAGLLQIAVAHKTFVEDFLAERSIDIERYIESIALHDTGKALIPDEVLFSTTKPSRREGKNEKEPRGYRELFWEVVYSRMQGKNPEAQYTKNFVRTHLQQRCKIDISDDRLDDFLRQEYAWYMSDNSEQGVAMHTKGEPSPMRIRLGDYKHLVPLSETIPQEKIPSVEKKVQKLTGKSLDETALMDVINHHANFSARVSHAINYDKDDRQHTHAWEVSVLAGDHHGTLWEADTVPLEKRRSVRHRELMEGSMLMRVIDAQQAISQKRPYMSAEELARQDSKIFVVSQLIKEITTNMVSQKPDVDTTMLSISRAYIAELWRTELYAVIPQTPDEENRKKDIEKFIGLDVEESQFAQVA